jgi:hypothetical protein
VCGPTRRSRAGSSGGSATRDPTAARNGAFALAEAHPGRFALGLGVSHKPLVDSRGHDYAKPLTAMRAYLDGLDAIARRLREHLDAGADHVCVQPVGTELAGAVAELERLAVAVLSEA